VVDVLSPLARSDGPAGLRIGAAYLILAHFKRLNGKDGKKLTAKANS